MGFSGPEICLFRPFSAPEKEVPRVSGRGTGEPGTDGVPWPFNEVFGFLRRRNVSVSMPGCRCLGGSRAVPGPVVCEAGRNCSDICCMRCADPLSLLIDGPGTGMVARPSSIAGTCGK